ncbi:hypothetical protein LH707_002974 [Vibrio cholerae]|nr:hypothetical protein [Vibrio cholerae]
MRIAEQISLIKLKFEVEKLNAQVEFIRERPWLFLIRTIIHPIRKFIVSRLNAKRIRDRTIAQKPESVWSKNGVILSRTEDKNRFNVSFSDMDSISLPERSIIFENNNKRIIFIHAFYMDEAIYILEKIRVFKSYDFLITTNSKDIADLFSKNIESNCLNIILTPNHGRDVFPFLLCLHFLNLDKYSGFVKVHTKRSQHLNDQGTWFKSNIDLLLYNESFTDRLLSLMDPNLSSLYGVETLPIQDHLNNNFFWMKELIGDGYENIEAKFIPGTMFIGSAKFLNKLASKKLYHLNIETENAQLDGCCVHALERYFGYLTLVFGGECSTIESLALKENS